MPSVVTLEELSKRPVKELMKMFYLNEREARNLKTATIPKRYKILTDIDLKIVDMTERLESSYGHVIEQRGALRKVGFEILDRRGLTIQEDGRFEEDVYNRLDKGPHLMDASKLHEHIGYPTDVSAFSKKLSILQRESEENPELHLGLIRKVQLPCGLSYYLQKNIDKVGETLAREGNINSIFHISSIPEDLRMAVSKTSVRLDKSTNASKIYHALSSYYPINYRVIAERTGLEKKRLSIYLNELRKLGLARKTERGFWIRAS